MASHNPHRVYIPTNAHSNQYLLAEIKLDDGFYSHYASSEDCYQGLAQQLFNLADALELRNVHLIANDKLPVVRFHTESYTFQTEKQILFFYNPRYHEGQNLFVTPGYQARKIRLLFLATGEELRSQAASFHGKVVQLLKQLKSQLAEPCAMKLRDHQHLSYDLFAKTKGHKESYGYKLRGLYPRYQARQCELPAEHSEITYVTVTLPLSRALKQQLLHERSEDFSPLYQSLQDKFQQACAGKKLDRLAMVANGLTPLVRNSKWDQHDKNRELQKISFNPDCSEPQYLTFWQADNLVESAHFVLVASKEDNTEMGYGRFMNQVEDALRSFAKSIGFDGNHQNLTVRFFQHISYVL
ncbi:DUF3083 family protein [Alkalimonas sp.]|uniref:DUF3083 family protein n=1 Tax=Alkalimonas sp. TaxID=1872453 RepID=UPI00263A7C38|nr:DUF3083 family protein [Alkalimonas sp.]MCC5825618.1 DUF3083 family protein [Alkalimonas sp.]